jgi:Lar family restriction alleviation protein
MRLNQCPFCGNTEDNLALVMGPSFTNPTIAFVECKKCGAQGPREKDPDKATEKWNKLKRKS